MNNTDPTGSLLLELLDSGKNRLNDRVYIKMKHLEISYSTEISDCDASKLIRISGLKATQPGVYLMTVIPVHYHTIGGTVKISEGRESAATFKVPIRSGHAKPEFPAYDQVHQDLRDALERIDLDTIKAVKRDCEKSDCGDYGSVKGKELYVSMEPKSRAGLLNVFAKMKSTVFDNGRDAFSYVNYFTCFQEDRFYALVDPDLRTVTNANSSIVPHEKVFHPDTGAAHIPTQEFSPSGSVKSWDHYGNLQLTFSDNSSTGAMMIDADIDDAQWIEHGFQVLQHRLNDDRTDPYRIHEVLSIGQGIDPLYSLTAV